MEIIRLQNETPEVYTAESRDFQVLCRIFDLLLNSTKFDVDSIKKISDTSKIRSEMLPLLQTKLGFFSNAKADAEELRLLLSTFPLLVKKKGSLKSIQEAINTYIKTLGLRIPFVIMRVEKDTSFYNMVIHPHNIIIGLNTGFKNTSRLFKDLLKYILPTGFGCYLYFYSSFKDVTKLIYSDNVAVLFISNYLNSNLSEVGDYINTDGQEYNLRYRLKHATALTELMSYEDFISPKEIKEISEGYTYVTGIENAEKFDTAKNSEQSEEEQQ